MPTINFLGYSDQFLGAGRTVPLPKLSPTQLADLAPVKGTSDNIAHYANYSVAVSRSRGFPFFAASNIDGTLFKSIGRNGSWRKDTRINAEHQWGTELYGAAKSDFDKGHMTKREDVQWGADNAIANEAGRSTFFYTNAVPQHARLNQRIWKKLEDYILHDESVDDQLRIMVFTGPVLSDTDPEFVTPVRNQTVRIPVLFWKVVVFAKSDGTLSRVGFLMGQRTLLESNQIVRVDILEELENEDNLFLQFEKADTYQVNVSVIESLTGLTMPVAKDIYQDDRPTKLVIQKVDVTQEMFPMDIPRQAATFGFVIEGLVL
ncbi:hypothetical protein GCM10027592_17280 [Spirosoma flavus]